MFRFHQLSTALNHGKQLGAEIVGKTGRGGFVWWEEAAVEAIVRIENFIRQDDGRLKGVALAGDGHFTCGSI